MIWISFLNSLDLTIHIIRDTQFHYGETTDYLSELSGVVLLFTNFATQFPTGVVVVFDVTNGRLFDSPL